MDKITRERMKEYVAKSQANIESGVGVADDVLVLAMGIYLESCETLITHLGSKVAHSNYVEELKLARAMSKEDQLKFINASLMTEFHKDLL